MYVYIVVYHSGEKTVQWPSGQFIGVPRNWFVALHLQEPKWYSLVNLRFFYISEASCIFILYLYTNDGEFME